jgi:hypothetical protein
MLSPSLLLSEAEADELVSELPPLKLLPPVTLLPPLKLLLFRLLPLPISGASHSSSLLPV